jgi:regulatory protein
MEKKKNQLNYSSEEWQERGYTKAATYCSRSEHCAHEVRTKLAAWGVPEEFANKIIARLKEEKFLDDNRYLAAFVKDKSRFSRWGKLKIGYTLRGKGFSESQIAEALSVIDDGDNTATLRELLEAKAKTIKYKDDYDRKAKLIRFALGRGFEYELIKKIIVSI